MDFGLGAFIERFEAHFGASLTRTILALVAATIATFCLSTLYNLAIVPIWKIFTQIFPYTQYGALSYWFSVVGFTLIVWWSLMAGTKTVEAYRERNLRKELQDMLKRAEKAQNDYNELKIDFEEYRDKVSATYLIADSVISAAEQANIIDENTVSDLRGLMNSEL